MIKITKKAFINTLCTKRNYCVGSPFRWTDEKVKNALNNMTLPEDKSVIGWRAVKTQKSNCLVFESDSRLYFDNDGTKTYYKFVSDNGAMFIVQKTEVYDSFDDVINNKYVCYLMED